MHLKRLSSKKVDKILKQAQHIEQEKTFKPGVVEFTNTEVCKCRVVNFFGDVHTEVFTVQGSPNEQYCLAGCSNGDIKIYHIYEGKLLSMSNSSTKGGYPNTSCRWHPKGNGVYTTCNCDGTIKWYQKNSDQLLGHYQGNSGYLCCDYQRSQGDWAVFGKDNFQLQIFDSETRKLKQKYVAGAVDILNPNHTNRIFSVRTLKQDKNIFFSGGWDSTVRVWDVRLQECVRKFSGPSISGDSLDYKKGELLVGNYQNHDILQIWDFKQGQLIQTLDINQKQHGNSYCFSATYAENSEHHVIAAGLSGSNKVKILKNKKLVAQMHFQGAPLTVDFYRFNNKDFLLVGGVQGTIYAIKVKWLQ